MIKVTVDVVIFAIRERALSVLLVERGFPPFKGSWAIPGGFVEEEEALQAAALRELEEETGVTDLFLEQLYTFGDPGRDPRSRTVTVAYFALVAADRLHIVAGSDAARAQWWPVAAPPRLAFDHAEILDYALLRLRNKLEYTTVGFQLLPERFTLGELQAVYEAILAKKIDKRNFRRKMDLLGVVEPLEAWQESGRRPARLYRFSAKRFEKLKDKGILFPF